MKTAQTEETKEVAVTVEEYTAFVADTHNLINEIHTTATPLLQAIAETKLRIMDGEDKQRLQDELFAQLVELDIHSVLDAIDGLEVLKHSIQHFTSL